MSEEQEKPKATRKKKAVAIKNFVTSDGEPVKKGCECSLSNKEFSLFEGKGAVKEVK